MKNKKIDIAEILLGEYPLAEKWGWKINFSVTNESVAELEQWITGNSSDDLEKIKEKVESIKETTIRHNFSADLKELEEMENNPKIKIIGEMQNTLYSDTKDIYWVNV